MKTYIRENKVVVIAIIIVLILTAFFWLQGSSSESASSASQGSALATTLSPDMSVTTSAGAKPSLIASTTEVYASQTLTTSQTGRGIVEEQNGTATVLDYDTSLTLAEDAGNGSRVTGFLGTGAMWARVAKVFGKGEYYQIKTQNAVAVVRGTSFGVYYKNHLTTIMVVTGTVGVSPVDLATGDVIPGKEVLVEAGFGATVDDSGVINLFPLDEADRHDPWYLFNNPVTETVKKVVNSVTNTVNTTVGPIEITTGTATKLTARIVRPSQVEQGNLVTVYGTGFTKVTAIYYGKTKLTLGDYDIVSDTAIEIETDSMPAGVYSIDLVDSTGAVVTLTSALTITVPPPPPTTTPTRTILYPRTI